MSTLLDISLLDLARSLVHFLWQGAALGALAWLCLGLLRASSPRARYLVACTALTAMLAAPVATFWVIRASRAPVATMSPRALRAAAPAEAPNTLEAGPRARPLPESWTHQAMHRALPCALAVWCAGVLAMGARLLGGWLWLRRRLWRDAEPADSQWQTTLRALARRLGIHQEILLMKAKSIRMPMVIGWLEPIVLVPAAALAGMDPLVLEAILAHELAHIRRHDYLVNLLQSLVEVLLFYHPAVWWISRQIRIERENCCDDVAVEACGDALLYAKALAHAEEFRHSLSLNPELALAANGGNLMNRIQRLLQPQLPPSPRARAGLMAALAASLLGAGTAVAITEDKGPKEHTDIVVKAGDESLRARLNGDAKIDATAQGGVALGEGASVEIASVDANHKTRRYRAAKEKGEVKRVYRVDGAEKALDTEGETWLKAKLAEMEKFQAQLVRTKGDAAQGKDVDVYIRQTEKGEGKEGQQGGDSRRVVILRSGPGPRVFPLGEGSHWVDAEALARDARRQAEDFQKLHGEELKKLREDSKKLAEEARKNAEAFRKEHEKEWRELQQHGKELHLRLKDLPHGDFHLEPLELDEPFLLDLPDFSAPEGGIAIAPGHGGTHHYFLCPNPDPKLEAEHLKKQIEALQKRLEKVQKRVETAPKEKAEKRPAPKTTK